jgi:hypothetical protein
MSEPKMSSILPTPRYIRNASTNATATVRMRRAGETYCGPWRARMSGYITMISAITITRFAATASDVPKSPCARRVGQRAAPLQNAGEMPHSAGYAKPNTSLVELARSGGAEAAARASA